MTVTFEATRTDGVVAAGVPDRSLMIREIVVGSAAIAGHKRCAVGRRLLSQGVSMAHLQVLWLLMDHGAMPMSRLAEYLGIAVPNATGLVDRMELRGLVARDRLATDRRLVIVRPTEDGQRTVDEIDGWRAEMMESVLDRLDDDQLERLVQAIRAIREAFASEAGQA